MNNNESVIKRTRRYKVLVIAIVCIVSLVLGSTLAWFTSRSQLKDSINFGTISVNATSNKFISISVDRTSGLVMPGDDVTIKYNIENLGEDAYYLTKVSILNATSSAFDEIAGLYAGSTKIAQDAKEVAALAAGETLPMTHAVEIPRTLGNSYQGTSATISVVVYAIQQANLEETEAYDEIIKMIDNDAEGVT